MAARKTNVFKTHDYTWTFEAALGDDKATSSLRYKDDFTGFASRVPLGGSPHPDLPGLILTRIKCAREEGGQITVNLDYEANSWEADYPGRKRSDAASSRFNMEPSLSDEPILTFYKFADFSSEFQDAIRTYQASDRTGTDYNTCNGIVGGDADALAMLDAIAAGQESWRAPQVIWMRRRIVKRLSDIPFEKVGKIDTPPQDKNNEPETPDGYNWMYLAPNISDTNDGNAYQVEERWQRSYEGGWSTFFYEYTA